MILAGDAVKKYEKSVTLKEIAKGISTREGEMIVAVRLDGLMRDLQTPLGNYRTIEFVSSDSEDGRRIYQRSVVFLLITAVHELEPFAQALARIVSGG